MAAQTITLPHAQVQPHGDAALFALGQALEAAQAALNATYAAERDGLADAEECDRAFEVCCKIVDAIALLPAGTFAALRVKAKAVRWCHSGGEIVLDPEPATDVRLAQSVLNDLLRMGEAA